MITVRIALEQPYSYVEGTFETLEGVDEQALWDFVTRLNSAQEPPQQNDADTAPQERRAPQPPPQGQQRRQSTGTGLFCPEHGVEVMKTAAKYDQTGDKFYHPLAEHEWYRLDDGRQVKNCNLWRSALLDAKPY